MHCHLFIPDFFAGSEADDRFGAAETLIAKGRRKRLAAISPEAWLFGQFRVAKQRDWPVAPYSMLADGGVPGRDFWLRADPVHLRVNRDRLAVADSALFDVSRAEAAALVEALEGSLPAGRDAMRFHALMNEAQMLLHEHPVNLEREARGEPAINSVWFWGGGAIGAAKARPYSAVIGDDPLARGLALAAGIPARALPERADSLLAAAEDEGVVLIVLDAMQHGDAEAAGFRERRAAIERDWFEPLLGALQSGRIGMLTLHLPGKDTLLEVETVRSDLRYFWRRCKPLSAYV